MSIKSLAQVAIGGALVVVGTVLLVLPGPGLLLVVTGLTLLANVFPRLERYVKPVRARAMKAAEDSVSSPWRLAGSALGGCALIAAGLALGLVPQLPFSGWTAGSSVIASGIIVLSLLIYAYLQVRRRRDPR